MKEEFWLMAGKHPTMCFILLDFKVRTACSVLLPVLYSSGSTAGSLEDISVAECGNRFWWRKLPDIYWLQLGEYFEAGVIKSTHYALSNVATSIPRMAADTVFRDYTSAGSGKL